MVEGSGRDLVEDMVRSLAPIPEALLLTGGRPGVEMMCGQGVCERDDVRDYCKSVLETTSVSSYKSQSTIDAGDLEVDSSEMSDI